MSDIGAIESVGTDEQLDLRPQLEPTYGAPALETAPATITDLGAASVTRRPPAVAGSVTQRFAKRAIDIVGSAVLILLLLPLAVVISLAIVLGSRGPAVFVQQRVGRRGDPFSLMKFRTMVRDGDAVLAACLARDPEARIEWETTRKLRDDPRITRIGRFLRRTSLDELPQLLNVLLGNMSLVGPRPVMEDELRYFGYRTADVLSVRPGLTGLWAVSGRSEVTYEERVELEYEYAVGWSFLGDLSILLRTLPAIVRGHGAF
jgi:exopolysaccharide production protein ExoY